MKINLEFLYVVFSSIVFLDKVIMAYSTKRTSYTTNSRNQPTYSHAQVHHTYEEQPYYVNETANTRDTRRPPPEAGVSEVLVHIEDDPVSRKSLFQIILNFSLRLNIVSD